MSTEDSKYRDGEETARGWKAKKYYLSAEAIELLAAHCKGTPLTMSAWIDMTIKRELDSPAERFLREQQPVETMQKLLDEGRRQLADLTNAGRDANETRAKLPPNRTTFVVPAGYEAVRDAEGRATGDVRPIVKQPTKKDFKVDL